MTFKTKLSTLFNSADKIVLDSYEIDEDMWKTRYPDRLAAEDRQVPFIDLDMSVYDYGEYTFMDQEVEVDDGFVSVLEYQTGEDMVIQFRCEHGIRVEDLR